MLICQHFNLQISHFLYVQITFNDRLTFYFYLSIILFVINAENLSSYLWSICVVCKYMHIYTPSHRKPFTSFSVHHKFKEENTQTHAFQILEKWKIIVTCYFAFWSSSKIYWLKHKWSEFHYNIAFILYTWVFI